MAAEPPITNGGVPPQPATNETAMADAIQRVTAHTQALVKDEIDLAKLEVQQKAKVFGRGAAIGGRRRHLRRRGAHPDPRGPRLAAWYELFPDDQFFWGFFLDRVHPADVRRARRLRRGEDAEEGAGAGARAGADARRVQTQATYSEETALLKEQVREVVVKPEDQRS